MSRRRSSQYSVPREVNDVAQGSGNFRLAPFPEGAPRRFPDGTDPGGDHQLAPLEEAALAHHLLTLQTCKSALPSDTHSLTRCFDRALRSLYMSFQPIVYADGAAFAYEALLRPNDPVLLNPIAMLEAAERLERIEQLGRIIRLRCAEAFASASVGDALLFVNLHAADLSDRTLMSQFAPLTQIAGRVVLEITERTSLDHLTDIRDRIAELRSLGFRIAIDDLGAGHSRMRMLTPVDTDFVKLDQSLVRGIEKNPATQSLVRSIVDNCHRHGIYVIGEGVESTTEADVLLEIGCDLLQGYLYGRPTPSLH